MHRLLKNGQSFLVELFIVIALFISVLHAEKVCKFEYTDLPEKINGDTLFVPDGTVGMSEVVKIGDPSDIVVVGNACSIMFLVDVSVSNYQTDYNAVRFQVLTAILDTIYRKNPKVRVGLDLFGSDLWFNTADDPLFKAVSRGPGVIPLLRLDSTYSGIYTQCSTFGSIQSVTNYTKSGIDVLKMYLRTKQWSSVWGFDPLYQPSTHVGGTTNITAGFSGAKFALGKSPHSLDRRFIIFLSDGGADPDAKEYIKATNTPTTFTIFYNPNPNDLQELQEFTDNVRNNGFSTSNPMSNLWDMSMDKNSLITLMTEKILSKIITSLTTFKSNGKMSVNGLSGIQISDSGFSFLDLFSLQQKYTDFKYDIGYHIVRDSITTSGDTVVVDEYDSTVNVDYNVCIDSTKTTSDHIDFSWWNRDINFFYKSNEITENDFISQDVDTLELRFEYNKIDTLYDYSSISDTLEFELMSKATSDREIISMVYSGGYFSCRMPLLEAGADNNNGILEHGNKDTLVAVFRNEKLPLDTLRTERIYLGTKIFSLTKAIYFDNDADGHVDSVFVGVSGKEFDKYGDQIEKEVKFADFRKFTVNNYTLESGGIGFTVSEGCDSIVTYSTSEDLVSVDSIQLGNEGLLMPGSVEVIDSIAPVVMKASFIDSVKDGSEDLMTVTLSEDCKNYDTSEPYDFIQTSSKSQYSVTLTLKNYNNKTAVYAVEYITGVDNIADGDSLWINSEESPMVADKLSNFQDNKNNRKVPINVSIVPDGIFVQRADCYDVNADGFADKIVLLWNCYTGKTDANTVVDKIKINSFRNFTIDSSTVLDSGIVLFVEDNSNGLSTAIKDNESVEIKDTVKFFESINLLPSKVSISDSMAPVVLNGILDEGNGNSINDQLTVTFSEAVNIVDDNEPLLFVESSGDNFRILLNKKSLKDSIVLFDVINYLDGVNVERGDSLWINVVNKISDGHIFQNNINNIKRPLDLIKAISVVSAKYKENELFSDGLIDSVIIDFNTDLDEKLMNSIFSSVILPQDRNISKEAAFYKGSRIVIATRETGVTKSSVTRLDSVTIPFFQTDSCTMYEQKFLPEDSLPPVIVKAVYIPGDLDDNGEYLKDSLRVKFSEMVKEVNVQSPFNFFDIGSGGTYKMTLAKVSSGNDSIHNFYVENSTKEFPQNGDSIWIDLNGRVEDVSGIVQQRNNIKVLLEVQPYPYSYKLYILPNPFRYDDESSSVKGVATKYFKKDDLNFDYNSIAVIAIPIGRVPTNLRPTGIINIYDAVGNLVYRNSSMNFNPDNGVIYAVWEKPKNTSGRLLGSSSLLLVMQIEAGTQKIVKKGTIGIIP